MHYKRKYGTKKEETCLEVTKVIKGEARYKFLSLGLRSLCDPFQFLSPVHDEQGECTGSSTKISPVPISMYEKEHRE